ncbi:SDR family oxidoreductase [Portibacter lacus]|uniref:Short-chain dehydrogenase n=1 Tax=Portibacter lacus TaxID=1099794 RepID=A0AA37SKF8_9BACT|nr:SDR family oxidoreductase [Portibacter lacus]GLR16238.1 short-chain dehydrogenase [Portibacter lacus]
MDQIALVTGANRGLGLGVVKKLLQLGYTVILTSRDQVKGQEAIEELDIDKNKLYFQQLDVSSSESINRCFDWVNTKFGKLDVLVNNAGINYDTWQNAMNADLQECHKTMMVNLFGPWEMAQKFYPLMEKNGFGRIVNVSSGAGSLTNEEIGTPGYSISKAALNMLTIKLAGQAKGSGVLINAVSPGWVRTDMGGEDADRSIAEGAESIVWAVTIPDDGPHGGFFKDGKRLNW